MFGSKKKKHSWRIQLKFWSMDWNICIAQFCFFLKPLCQKCTYKDNLGLSYFVLWSCVMVVGLKYQYKCFILLMCLFILIVKCEALRITQGWQRFRNILEVTKYPGGYEISCRQEQDKWEWLRNILGFFWEPVPIYPGYKIYYDTVPSFWGTLAQSSLGLQDSVTWPSPCYNSAI